MEKVIPIKLLARSLCCVLRARGGGNQPEKEKKNKQEDSFLSHFLLAFLFFSLGEEAHTIKRTIHIRLSVVKIV